ncbi:MAG TPA: glucose-1-phosphate cytidylyltransferase [Polyangiaceae bacterium]
MKAILLAGGMGTRLGEETSTRPKPMVEIGGKPILWHIMKGYSFHGVNEFVVCLGYKGYLIKEYFANYFLHVTNVTVDLRNNQMTVHSTEAEPWLVTLVDTGLETNTSGRLRRVRSHVGNETCCMTYGDGVSNVDIQKLIAYHRQEGRAATVTAVQPEGRFGALEIEGARVARFLEKPAGDGAWINGGFFVLEPSAIDFCVDDAMAFERKPLEDLAAAGQLSAFRHQGFWHPMDTVRDRNHLESLWQSGSAPWKTWE